MATMEKGMDESWSEGLGHMELHCGMWKGLLRSHHHLLQGALGTLGGTALGTGAVLGHGGCRAAVWDACTRSPLHPCWNAQGVSHRPHVPGAHTSLHVHMQRRKGAAQLVSPPQ